VPRVCFFFVARGALTLSELRGSTYERPSCCFVRALLRVGNADAARSVAARSVAARSVAARSVAARSVAVESPRLMRRYTDLHALPQLRKTGNARSCA
jgi:hypothetical protein